MVDKTTESNSKEGGITGKGWKKGQSGNPNGRPRGTRSIPDILKKIGLEDGTKDGQFTKLEVVLRQVFTYALEGKAWAVEFIAERTEGKVTQALEVGLMPQVSFTPIEQMSEEDWNEKITEHGLEALPMPEEVN